MPDRYHRQTILPEVGAAGQARLGAARVVIVGCGGLGGPVAAYLAGAGVGGLDLVDGDRVALSNLHRQVFFTESALGQPKADTLAAHCRRLNPGTRVRALNVYAEPRNLRQLISGATLVVDATDDAPLKHHLSDACHLLGVPLVYAAVHKYEGYVAVFPNAAADDVHLRDLFPAPDPDLPDCATVGVLPTAVGAVALLQANAALCYLLGIGAPPLRQLLTVNLLDNRQHRLTLRKTYHGAVVAPWATARPARAELETDATPADFGDYDLVFTMLDAAKDPTPAPGVVRLTKRDPFGQCTARMTPAGRYLLYCNSGKLSLMLAAQLQKAGYRALSLRGGKTW